MKYALFALLGLLTLPLPAVAAGCYGAAEQEASQLVRLHSQLMVITLSCRTTDTGEPLPPAYQKFTQTHLQAIKDAERRLMLWHKGGTGKLDRIRTDFSNEYSRELARMSPKGYCDAYRNYVVTASGFSQPQLGQELQKMAAGYSAKVKACAAKPAPKTSIKQAAK